MKTAVNSIHIPFEYIRIASYWHSGQDDMLYAVASTGSLTTGSRRPYDDGRPYTDEEWYWSLWADLAASLRRAVHACVASGDENECLNEFLEFAEKVSERLEMEYAIDI
jgi:hypothetical protein